MKNSNSTSKAQAPADYEALEQEQFNWTQDWIKERYRYLRVPGAAEDCHHVIAREFRARANKLGLYLSDGVIAAKARKWIDWWLNNPLKYSDIQRLCGRIRALAAKRAKATLRQYRAHILRRAGLSKAAIARQLNVHVKTIYRDLKTPLAEVKLKRRRLTAAKRPHQPRPQPQPEPVTAANKKADIGFPLVPSKSENPDDRNTTNRNPMSHLPAPPPDIDVITELEKHWEHLDQLKNAQNAQPTTRFNPAESTKSLMRQAP